MKWSCGGDIIQSGGLLFLFEWFKVRLQRYLLIPVNKKIPAAENHFQKARAELSLPPRSPAVFSLSVMCIYNICFSPFALCEGEKKKEIFSWNKIYILFFVPFLLEILTG